MIGEFGYLTFMKLFRKYLQPSLSDFQDLGCKLHHNFSIPILELFPNAEDKQIQRITDEYYSLLSNLYDRKPSFLMEVDKEAGKLIYAFLRLQKPRVVMETGVAQGVSTFFILNAMNNNEYGSLTSIDISPNVASILQDQEKVRWKLKILDVKNKPRNQFKQLLYEMDGLSMFLHDGDHSYVWQKMEYESAITKIENGGILISDDIDSSYAFIDFIKEQKQSGRIASYGVLVGQGKLFGYDKIQ